MEKLKKIIDFCSAEPSISLELEKVYMLEHSLPEKTHGKWKEIIDSAKIFYQIKTKRIDILNYHTLEPKNHKKIFKKFRLSSIIGCFPYTSDEFPWPKDNNGNPLHPLIQLDLDFLKLKGIECIEDGLLQVWASESWDCVRIIPRMFCESNLLTNEYLVEEHVEYNYGEGRLFNTHQVITEIFTAGTMANPEALSLMLFEIEEHLNTLPSIAKKKYKRLIGSLSNLSSTGSSGSYFNGFGFDRFDHSNISDSFMQMERPIFDFGFGGVMDGFGYITHSPSKGFNFKMYRR